jgi:hypothetical protein
MRITLAIALGFLAATAQAGIPEKPAPATGPAVPASVTIPLDRYDELQKSAENSSATIVDTLALAGTFRDHNLTATFTGRSVGTRGQTPILSEAPDLTLSACSGDAIVLRTGRGVYALVALAPAFVLRCEARPSGSDRLRMSVAPTVLAVRSDVADGEMVSGEEDSEGGRSFTLVRQVLGGRETLATTATGRYLITLLPDATRFRYVVQVHNPNRSTSPLQLQLVSGEHLQQIDSAATYEPKGDSYTFAMPPGDSTITLSGELQGTSFTPPVDASLQYLVVESHPLLRPAMSTQTKRISTAETGIDTQYRGALAFEIRAKEKVSWTVTRLEAMRAISYSVLSVQHTLFIPADGPVLGESNLTLDNQGAPELVLPRRPEPTFVSLQGEPVLMTRNATGELTVPLSAGQQRIVVQHRQPISQFGVVAASLEVPRLPIAATNTNATLRYPEHWLPLWQSFGSRTTTWRPELETVLIFLLLVLWIERLIAAMHVVPKKRLAVALCLAFASALLPLVFWIVILACAISMLLWLASHRKAISIGQLIGVVVLGLIVFFVLIVSSFSERRRAPSYSSAPATIAVTREEQVMTDTAVTDTMATSTTGTAESPKAVKVAPRSDGTFAYQGLPAKFELPGGVRSESFNEQMLSPEHPQRVTVLLLSMAIVTWLAIALAALGVWLLWLERRSLASAFRQQLDAAAPKAGEAT